MNRRGFLRQGIVAGGLGIGALGTAALTAAPMDLSQFGVRGDGKADDSTALQTAIDKCVDKCDGVLHLGRGTYRLTKTLTIDLTRVGPFAVVGDGGARLVMESAGPALRFVGNHGGTADPPTVKDDVWKRQRLPLVSGIEIVGGHEESVGIEMDGTFQPTLTALLIRRCGIGVRFTRRNRNPIVDHCHIYHNRRVGIVFDRVNLHQAIISNCHISYNPQAGIWFRGGEVRNVQIVGNDIEYNHDPEQSGCADVLIDVREDGATFREGTIVGNTIQARVSPAGANVRVLGGKELRTSGLLSISGNLVGSQETTIHLADARGVSVTGNSLYSAAGRNLVVERCANVVLSANSIDWNPDHRGKRLSDGIAIADSDGVVLSDTILENSFAGSKESGGSVEVDRSRDVTISNCQILDPRHRGIVLRDTERCRVSGCSVIDRRPESTLAASLQISGRSRDNEIRGNTFQRGKIEAPTEMARLADNAEWAPPAG